jgi:Rrf2 family protein
MTSSRFSVAVHVLALLAWKSDEALSSEFIAGSVNTNPVVIRRLIGLLRAAKLVQTQPGRGGGFLLSANPRTTTLLDIYKAIEERDLITLHEQPNPKCPIGRNITEVLEQYTGAAERALRAYLETVTLQDVVGEIEKKIAD